MVKALNRNSIIAIAFLAILFVVFFALIIFHQIEGLLSNAFNAIRSVRKEEIGSIVVNNLVKEAPHPVEVVEPNSFDYPVEITGPEAFSYPVEVTGVDAFFYPIEVFGPEVLDYPEIVFEQVVEEAKNDDMRISEHVEPKKVLSADTKAEIARLREEFDTYRARYPKHRFNEEYALEAMIYIVEEMRYSKYGAAGMIGNVFSECEFIPSAGEGDYYIGIMQWDWRERWPRITNWLSKNGYDQYDFMGQVKAIFGSDDYQPYQKVFEKMRTMEDERVAATYWQILYEGAEGQADWMRKDGATMCLLLYEIYDLQKT